MDVLSTESSILVIKFEKLLSKIYKTNKSYLHLDLNALTYISTSYLGLPTCLDFDKDCFQTISTNAIHILND